MKALRFIVAIGAGLVLAATAAAEVAVGASEFVSTLTPALLQPGPASGAVALATLGAVAAWPRRRHASRQAKAKSASHGVSAIPADYTVWGEPGS